MRSHTDAVRVSCGLRGGHWRLNDVCPCAHLFDKFYLASVRGAPIPLRGRFGAPRIVELTLNTRF